MSRIFPTPTLRSLAVAGILSTAALSVPAAAHAQTGGAERALLGRVAISAAVPLVATWQPAVQVQGLEVNGERALLARTAHGPDLDPAGAGEARATLARPVDGARALLGRWTTDDSPASRRILVGESRRGPALETLDGARP